MTLKWMGIAFAATIGAAYAQTSVTVPRAEFDVASIKPNTSGARGVRIGAPSPGRFNAENVWLRFMIQLAWNVKDFQVLGGPGWAASDRYDIEATAGGSATLEQMKPMIQALLEDRFHLAVHSETKELPVYELVTAKGGIKPQTSKDGSCVARSSAFGLPAPGQTPPNVCGNMMMSPRSMSGNGISMRQIATALSNALQRTVVDKTGLSGVFDVHVEWTPDQSTPGLMAPGLAPVANQPSADDMSGSIFSAIQEQLGLRLQPAKGAVEVLVIDHLEKPSENQPRPDIEVSLSPWISSQILVSRFRANPVGRIRLCFRRSFGMQFRITDLALWCLIRSAGLIRMHPSRYPE